VQYDSISRFAARYDEIRISNLHTNSINVIIYLIFVTYMYN
jgi:hypothetical protein